jgi:hypothetical protein
MKHISQTRSNRCFPWIFVLSVTFILVPCLTHAVCEDEPEVACSETTLLLKYGDHTSECIISPIADVDTFVFDGVGGDTARVTCSGMDLDFDCRIEVWAPDTTKIADVSCSANAYNWCSISVDVPLPSTGTYSIAISDSGNNNPGNYSLNLEQLPPDDAQHLLYDVTEACELNPISDSDKFYFYGVAGTTIRLVLSGTALDLDPCLEIWNPEGTKFDWTCCSANAYNWCSTYKDIVLPATGKYSIHIFDSGYNNPGTYEVHLQCLVGGCPLCTGADDCNDGNICTSDDCVDNQCQHTCQVGKECSGACPPGQCTELSPSQCVCQ